MARNDHEGRTRGLSAPGMLAIAALLVAGCGVSTDSGKSGSNGSRVIQGEGAEGGAAAGEAASDPAPSGEAAAGERASDPAPSGEVGAAERVSDPAPSGEVGAGETASDPAPPGEADAREGAGASTDPAPGEPAGGSADPAPGDGVPPAGADEPAPGDGGTAIAQECNPAGRATDCLAGQVCIVPEVSPSMNAYCVVACEQDADCGPESFCVPPRNDAGAIVAGTSGCWPRKM